MKPKLTTKQILACMRLLQNLKKFVDMRYGSITEVKVMYSPLMKDSIIVKYSKSYSLAGEPGMEFKICEIKKDGEMEFIDEKLKDIFERSAFLGQCIEFDITDENQYEKID